MNRLKNNFVYLAGAMDRVDDRGKGWRNDITPFLRSMGVKIFNPLSKPFTYGTEDDETHRLKKKLKDQQDYNRLSEIMKEIRSVDLHMVDKSNFVIAYLDLDSHPCGTYEEIFWANRQKTPILIHIKQGKQFAPDWLFGTIPHQMMFSNWDDLKRYLTHINEDVGIETLDRWKFIDYSLCE